MTDKDKIKQEIKRRIDLYSIAEKDDTTFARMGELSSLMDFIHSLPEEPANDEEIEALNDVRHLNPGLDSLYLKLKKL